MYNTRGWSVKSVGVMVAAGATTNDTWDDVMGKLVTYWNNPATSKEGAKIAKDVYTRIEFLGDEID